MIQASNPLSSTQSCSGKTSPLGFVMSTLYNQTHHPGNLPPSPPFQQVARRERIALKVHPETTLAFNEVSTGIPDRGIFPLEVLPSVIRDYALELAHVYRVPVELPVLCMLGTLSGAIGKSRQAVNVVPERVTRANLYLTVSLSSGTGKSISARIAKPFTEFEADATERHEQEELPRLKGRQIMLEKELRRLKKAAQTDPQDASKIEATVRELGHLERDLEKSVLLSVGNFTTTGLGNALASTRDETLWVHSSEGGKIVDVMLGDSRSRAPHIELWLNGYSGEGYRQSRAVSSGGGGNSLLLRDMCLSALLLVQPSVAERLMLHHEARERGLLGRMLLIEVKSSPVRENGEHREVSPDIEARWTNLILGILEQRMAGAESQNIRCTGEAVEEFRAFHNDTYCDWVQGDLYDMDKELSRWRENAIKLALVLEAASGSESLEITREIAADAIALMRWIGIGVLELFEGQRLERFERRALRLEQALKHRGGKCLASDFERRHGFTVQEARQLARVFPMRFAVEPVQNGGRPGNVIKLVCQSDAAEPEPLSQVSQTRFACQGKHEHRST